MSGLNKKRFLCVVVVAALLLSIAVAVSQPVQAEKLLSLSGEKEELSPKGALKVPIRIVHCGHGFALKRDGTEEFHMLRVHIVRVRHLQPIYVRELMAKGMGIKEIRAEIEKQRGRYFYRGYLQFGENLYRLVNMSRDEANGSRVFNADIAGRLDNTESIVGHIRITVMRYEGLWIGDGELSMDEGVYAGEYKVLLNLLPSGL